MVTLTPNNATRVMKKYGGVEARPVSEAAMDRGLAIGIYGPGGIGKTTLAASITDSPIGSPALLLDARGNPHVISSYGERIDVLPVTRFSDVEKIRADILRDKEFGYKTIILDNVSEMFSIDLRDRYGPVADVDWTKHSATTADVLQLVRNFMDLTVMGPKVNLVFVFQETPEQRTIMNQQVSRSEISFNKALQSHVPTLISFLGRLYISETVPPYRRLLDFTPLETLHQAKLQIDPSDPASAAMPFQQYNPSLASILNTVRDHQPWPTDKHSRANTNSRPAS